MKRINKILILVVFILSFAVSSSFGQIADKGKFSGRLIGGGLALTGANSNNTTAGPTFGGSIAYGIGNGFALFAESGYGYTHNNSGNNVQLRQIPIIGGVTYNLGNFINSSVIQPYIGVAAGAYLLRLRTDGNPVFVSGIEQDATNFGAKALLGVNFKLNNDWSFEIYGNYTHIFDKNGDPGIESSEFNTVGFGAGLSYAF